jgi:hypothetical protein
LRSELPLATIKGGTSKVYFVSLSELIAHTFSFFSCFACARVGDEDNIVAIGGAQKLLKRYKIKTSVV